MGEWDEKYPINFSPTGDTTSQAIYKLMNEIDRIYELLNRVRKLDADGVPPSDPVVGHAWRQDNGDGTYTDKVWNGSEWVDVIDFDRLADIPQGEIILFEKDTAVVGYELLTDVDDSLVYITKGSDAGGVTGGSDRGSWTISGLTHPHTHDLSNHKHVVPVALNTGHGDGQIHGNSGYDIFWGYATGYNYTKVDGESDLSTSAGTDLAYSSPPNVNQSGNASTNVVSSDGTWRPFGRCFTRQRRL